MRSPRGFTVIDLLIALAILGVLFALSLTAYEKSVARSKRVEAFTVLAGIYQAQAGYIAEHEEFAPTFDDLGFGITGGERISATAVKGKRYTFKLSRPEGRRSFYVVAMGDLDGDQWPDVVTMSEKQ